MAGSASNDVYALPGIINDALHDAYFAQGVYFTREQSSEFPSYYANVGLGSHLISAPCPSSLTSRDGEKVRQSSEIFLFINSILFLDVMLI